MFLTGKFESNTGNQVDIYLNKGLHQLMINWYGEEIFAPRVLNRVGPHWIIEAEIELYVHSEKEIDLMIKGQKEKFYKKQ